MFSHPSPPPPPRLPSPIAPILLTDEYAYKDFILELLFYFIYFLLHLNLVSKRKKFIYIYCICQNYISLTLLIFPYQWNVTGLPLPLLSSPNFYLRFFKE